MLTDAALIRPENEPLPGVAPLVPGTPSRCRGIGVPCIGVPYRIAVPLVGIGVP